MTTPPFTKADYTTAIELTRSFGHTEAAKDLESKVADVEDDITTEQLRTLVSVFCEGRTRGSAIDGMREVLTWLEAAYGWSPPQSRRPAHDPHPLTLLHSWRSGDPEPEGVHAVTDRHERVWTLHCSGSWVHGALVTSWLVLARDHGDLKETR